MTGPLDITPDRLAAEAAAFQQTLVAGLDTLREVDGVDYGATDKDEVWRGGKVVLYRHRSEGKSMEKVAVLFSDAQVDRPQTVDHTEIGHATDRERMRHSVYTPER